MRPDGSGLYVSRGHFLLRAAPDGVVLVNGVPRRGGGVRAPLNGTWLLQPEHRRLGDGEAYLIRKGQWIKIHLPNDTQVVLSCPVDRALGSSLKPAALESEAGFRRQIFEQTMGFPLEDIARILTGLSLFVAMIYWRLWLWRRGRARAEQNLTARIDQLIADFPYEVQTCGGAAVLREQEIVRELVRQLEAP